MADFTIKQGDTLPLLQATLTDENGDPMDLTDATDLKFRYRRKGSSTVVERDATIVTAASGIVRYAWQAADTATAGPMYAEWQVYYGTDILTHPNTGFIDIEVVDRIDTLEDVELLMSVGELKRDYLFGVDLTDDAGEPYPREMFEHYLRFAAAWAEKELDIPLQAVDIVDEIHDHYSADYGRWGYFQLDKYPVISIATGGVKFQYPSTPTPVTIDDEWIVLEDEGQSGVIQIVPGQGNIADVLLIPGSLMPMWSGAFGRVPGVWRFSYRAGFETGQLPADIKHVIGMAASIGVLNIAGDLIAGAGIASVSISVPGLNQNVNTTSSATNSGYGARVLEYQKELKEQMPNLRRYYGKNTRMVVA